MQGEEYYRLFINGDNSAFEEIVKIYLDGLVFFINRYVHNVSDSEDIATDSFLYLYIHKNKYDFRYSLKTFLYTIGRSKALTFLKRNKNKKHSNIEDYINISDNHDVEESVLKSEQNFALYRAIKTLPLDMQNAVYLFYFENCSYDDISKILKMNVKQIDNLLYRAKKMLKEKLQEVSNF